MLDMCRAGVYTTTARTTTAAAVHTEHVPRDEGTTLLRTRTVLGAAAGPMG